MDPCQPRTAARAVHIGAAVLLCVLASIASAQWVWRDENGRTVYSDQPPPTGVKPGDVLRQPTPAAPVLQPEAADPAAAGTPGAAANPAPQAAAQPHAPTLVDREQEFRKRQKQRSEAEQKLAAQNAETAQKAQDCERARGYMKSLDDGVRLIRTNPDGSRELLGEDQRAAEVQRTRTIIDSRCN